MSRRAASPALLAARSAVDRSIDDQPRGASVVVACSGGPDSLALAGAAAWVGARRGLSVHAIVVDHGLQQHSSTIAARAAQQCLSLGLGAADVVEVQVGAVGGPEAAARAARYAALEEAAERLRAAVVLLGHTRDDQAETIVMRLLRGTGTRGLAA